MYNYLSVPSWGINTHLPLAVPLFLLGAGSMAVSGHGVEKPLVGALLAISLLCMNGLRKQSSCLFGLYFWQ